MNGDVDIVAGFAAAADELLDQAEAPAQAEQLSLLSEEGRAKLPNVPKATGRPLGSPNKSTLGWRDYWSRRYGSPVERLIRFGAMDIDVIATELNCSKETAAKLWIMANEKAAPYMHARLAQIEIKDRRGMPAVGDDANVVDGTATIVGSGR
jgi:hypothetical protein